MACTNKKSKQQVACSGIEGYRVKLGKNYIKVEHDDNGGGTSVGEGRSATCVGNLLATISLSLCWIQISIEVNASVAYVIAALSSSRVQLPNVS